jgi:hypothetical protein
MRDGVDQLRTAVEQLSRAHPDLHVGWGRAGEDFPALGGLATLGSDTLDHWLSATAQLAVDLDRKTAGSYLLSIFTWHLGQVLGGLYLSRLALPPLDGDAIGVKSVLAGPVGKRSLDFEFCVRPKSTGTPLDRAAMSASIVALLTPLLDGLHSRTQLARRAMWRLVTDGISAGFLSFGKLAGDSDLAAIEAEAILRRPALPLYNDRWRFATVEGGGTREIFRLRGGCCRLYRSPGHEFCTTCVLRTEADQIDRLEAYLKRKAAG